MSQTDQHKIVILDKNQSRRDYLRSIVSRRGYVPVIFEKEAICLDNLGPLQPDLVISGPLSDNQVYRFVNSVKMMDGSLPVLIISGDRMVKDFVALNGFGDIKILKKNFEPADIRYAISNLIRNRFKSNGTEEPEIPLIIGNDHKILKIKQKISELRYLNEPVLIQGEPGTGKELVARSIHLHSKRSSHAFIKVHLPDVDPIFLDKFVSGFGSGSSHESNPFSCRIDKMSDVGTLFLNEIAVVPYHLQARLKSIFEKIAFPLDRSVKSSSKMKIVVSSRSNLNQLVRGGKLRQDLYYRLGLVSLNIPPLRDRVGDIPLLTDFFTDQFCMELGIGHFELPGKIKDLFCRYTWPGNIRELKAIVRKMILNGGDSRTVQNIAVQSDKHPVNNFNFDDIYTLTGVADFKEYLRECDTLNLKKVSSFFLLRAEKAAIEKALQQTNWNRKKAANLLQISYKSLLNKIKEYRIT